MRVGQAKELFRALTKQYFGGANVVFANQSRTAKQKEPLVVLTPGNVHRPQAPRRVISRRWGRCGWRSAVGQRGRSSRERR